MAFGALCRGAFRFLTCFCALFCPRSDWESGFFGPSQNTLRRLGEGFLEMSCLLFSKEGASFEVFLRLVVTIRQFKNGKICFPGAFYYYYCCQKVLTIFATHPTSTCSMIHWVWTSATLLNNSKKKMINRETKNKTKTENKVSSFNPKKKKRL